MKLHDLPPSQDTLSAVKWFFNRYETATPEQLAASAFSDPTIVGDLAGSWPVPATVLAKGIVERAEKMRSLGLESTSLESWSALELSARHVLLTAQWQLQFGNGSLALISDYLLEIEDGRARCLTYTTRQDVLEEISALVQAT